MLEKYIMDYIQKGKVECLPPEVLADKTYMMEAMKCHPSKFYPKMSDELKDDKEIVRSAVSSKKPFSGCVFRYASERLQNDKEFVLEMVKKNDSVFDEVYGDLRDDKDIALAAIEQDSGSYLGISNRLQQDRDVVLLAVSKDGTLLERMDDCFKCDKEIVEAAVRNHGFAVIYSLLSEDSATSKERILKAAGERGIQNLVHFTPLVNISSIAQEGLVPREEMNKRNTYYKYTDSQRLENVNGTSLSVSFPNYPMLSAKYRDIGWDFCVLILDAEKILQKDCLFFSHNAATHIFNGYRELKHRFIDFDSMFAEYGDLRDGMESYYATNPQAEIMCLDVIPPDCIKECIVNNVNRIEECKEAFRECGRDIEVRYDPWYFGKGPYELTD